MSLITPDFGLIFWMVIIFGVVFFILARFGFPVITRMVQKRSDHIADSLRAADQAQAQLSELAARQEELLAETRQQQARILQEATRTRDSIVAQAKEQALKESAAILEQTRREVAMEKQAAINEIKSQVAAISMEVAEKVVRKNLGQNSEQDALLDRLVEEAGKAQLNS